MDTPKISVPQVSYKTGVSGDYWNEYFAAVFVYDMKGLPAVAEIFSKSPVQKYEQRFPQDKYEDVITEKNKGSIKRLDELADVTNANFNDISKFTDTEFKRLINEVRGLIYGDGKKRFPEVE